VLTLPWLIPGPQSAPVTAVNSIAMPAAGVTTILDYQVPQGLIFSLRGVVVNVVDPSGTWNEGGSQLVFQLQVIGSGGTRFVEFFAALDSQIGSRFQPYPILGRSEFGETDILRWLVTSDGSVTAGSPQFLIAHLIGHTYPAQPCS
jgi:hypothetical protein